MVPNSRVRSSVHPLGDLSRVERARASTSSLQQQQPETGLESPADKNSLDSDSVPPPPLSADSNESSKSDALALDEDQALGRRLLSPVVPVVESQRIKASDEDNNKQKGGWWAKLKDVGLAQLTYVGLGMMGNVVFSLASHVNAGSLVLGGQPHVPTLILAMSV